MTHDEIREQLELAAVEPGGLDRLIAGDTPTAGAIAGHLAACPECTREFEELRRSTMIIRAVIATQPPSELRQRTLDFVAAVGRPRGPAQAGQERVAAGGVAVTGSPPQDAGLEAAPSTRTTADSQPIPLAARSAARRSRLRSPLAWLAATAALIVLAVGLTAAVVGNQSSAASRQASLEIAGLSEVATWTARLEAEPDVQHVVLTAINPSGGTSPVGSLVFSGATQEMVVIADGLTKPDTHHEYGCWIEVAGARQRLGKMYVNGDVGYWVGDSAALASVPDGSRFGISLVDTSGSGANQPVMSGTLQGSSDSHLFPVVSSVTTSVRPPISEPSTDDPAPFARPDETHPGTPQRTSTAVLEPAPLAVPASFDDAEATGSAPRPGNDVPEASVEAMFDEIAPVYDRVNTIMTLGSDGRWRRMAVDATGLNPGESVIDVACGTGKLSAALADRVGPFGRVVGVDVSRAMVHEARRAHPDLVQLRFDVGNALSLPAADGEFDAATIAFGLRNLADYEDGFRELRRVVRAGGRIVCLELSMPRPRAWGRAYHALFLRTAPMLGSLFHRKRAYAYLPKSLQGFPQPDQLVAVMRRAGLVDVGFRRLALGAVAIHRGRVPRD